MSVVRQFRGRKRDIVERLSRGESPAEIVTAVGTSRSYVYNVRSELRSLGVEFVDPHRQDEPIDSPSREGERSPTSAPTGESTLVAVGGSKNYIQQVIDADPEVQTLRRQIIVALPRIAILRERRSLRQFQHAVLVHEGRLQNQDVEEQLRTAIVDICPNIPGDLFTNRLRYFRAMRQLLNQQPYHDILEVWVSLWGNTTELKLNAILLRFFEWFAFLRRTGLLRMSQTFVRDHVEQFFSFLTNPSFGLCPFDGTPRFLQDNRIVCALEHF
ncbi:MAG: helix-turn-helix domain-containing protein [Candidatus Bathyarchaeia archaeon]